MNPFTDIPITKLLGNDLPEGLREMPQPPRHLYVQGDLPQKGIYLTVVGSRRYSSYGKEACEQIIEGLKDYPFVIVSGLALGIDAIAHKQALSVGLPTVAVPGSGLDPSVIAPRTNFLLAKQILEKGGALVSEFEPIMHATPSLFPKRNRIMAGLSHAVLIIEAGMKSGTLITARLGLDYNKTIFSVPGPITSPTCEGSNWLIKEGATPVTSASDILEAFGFEKDTTHNTERSSLFDLSEDEKRLLDLLKTARNKSELLEKTSWNIAQLNVLITSLEIKGAVKDNGETFTTY